MPLVKHHHGIKGELPQFTIELCQLNIDNGVLLNPHTHTFEIFNWCFVEPTYTYFLHYSYVVGMFLELIS